MIIKGAR